MSYQPNPVPILCCDLIQKQATITKAILESTWRNKIYNEDVEMLSVDKFDVPFKGLREGISTLKNMREQIDELYEFVNNTKSQKFQECIGQILEWRSLTDLNMISMKYIEVSFPRRVTNDVERLLSGKEAYDALLKRYTDVVEVEDIAGSFYSSDIPKYVKLKQLSGINRVQDLVITTDLARLKLVDWLLKVTNCYLDGSTTFTTFERSSLDAIVTAVKKGFERLYDELENQNKAALEAIRVNAVKSAVTGNQINTLYSHIFNAVFGIESRIVILLYRMISANIANIRNLYEIYRKATKWTNGLDTVTLEEYDDEDWGDEKNLSLTNHTLMLQAAKQAISAVVNSYSIDKVKLDNIIARTTGKFPNLEPGEKTLSDASFYLLVQNFTSVLNSRISNMRIACATPGENKSFHDILAQYKLNACADLYVEWARTKFHSTPNYPDHPVTDIILGDLWMFMGSLSAESTRLHGLVETLTTTKTDFTQDVSKYKWVEDIGVGIDWCDSMINALGKINVILGWKYRERLVALSKLLPDTAPYSGAEPVYDTGYFPLHPDDDVDVQVEYEEACADEMISAINRKYMSLYMKKLNGIPYFEGEGDQGSSDTSSGNGDNSGTKPVVHDNADTSDSNNGDSNKSDKQNTTENNSDKKESIGKKIFARVQKKWQNFKDIIEKLTSNGIKAKNQKFLTNNRDFLISRNYTNTSVEMLPYIDNTDYIGMIRGCITKAASINDATLRTVDESGLRNAIFSGLKMPKTNDGLQADIVHGLKVGTAELKPITLSDNALKEKVPKMIEFCDQYYSKFEDELNGLEQEIKKLSIVDDKPASGGGDNDNTEKNKGLIGTYLSQAIVATRYASRDRCNDCLKVLSELASSNKKNKKSAQQESDESKKAE